jgi:heme-degrading monooxygenase HmoA
MVNVTGESVVIKVIVGYKLKKGANMQPSLLKLKSHSMTYSGFKGCEIIYGRHNSSIVVMASTWERQKDWKAWEDSKLRKELLQECEALLVEKPRVTIWDLKPPVRWVWV